ncbi:MAG: hypothetical protein G01um101420_738 [Parcubacteria group bacterium Gr01-1014_20]|nr:MAG: hypothetical protein G01um101420_738 [Parcubacteria group bacterium Gr01-1014_20]
MAIVIEETRRRTSFVSIFTWIVIISVIVAASYYIFFTKPATVDFVIPNEFQDTTELSTIKLNRALIDNDPIFGTLEPRITPPSEARTGRLNPFLPF